MSRRSIVLVVLACLGAGAVGLIWWRTSGPSSADVTTTADAGRTVGALRDSDGAPAEWRDRVASLTRAYAELDWPASSPEEIGRLLAHDPGRCLGFIRSAMRYEPYAGVLRGTAGALAAGAGNSADLALVLRDLLRGGVPAGDMRFAMATLPADRAATLVTNAMRAAPPQAVWAASAAAAQEAPPATQTEQERAALERAGSELSQVAAGVRDHLNVLARLLPASGLRDDREAALAAARQHVWLQVRRGSDWINLDPLLGDSGPAPASTASDLPAALRHRVSVSVELERDANGRLTRSRLLSREWPAEALSTQPLRLVIIPDGNPDATLLPTGAGPTLRERAKSWQHFRAALTLAGDKPVVGDAFDLAGSRVSSGRFGNVDVFGSARRRIGGPESEGPRALSLTGLVLAIELTSPDGPPIVIERWLLDRIGPAARAEGRVAIRPGLADADAVALAMVQRLDVLFPSGRMGAALLARDALAPLASTPLLERVGDLRQGSDVDLAGLALPSLPPDLIQVGDTALVQADAGLVGRGRAFLSRPNVMIHTEGFVLNGGGARTRSDLDLARAELTVLADPEAALEAKRRYGLFASEIEGPALTSVSPAGQVTSAALVLRRAIHAGVPFEVIASAGDLSRLSVDADARAVIAADLDRGYRIVAPVRATEAGAAAWWRVDAGGGPVASGSDGRGQAGSEGMMVLTDISIPSVERTMKFTACFNEAVAGGKSTSNAGGACLAQAIVDTVKASLDAAINEYIKNPLNEAMDDARAGMLGEDYDKLYKQAKDAWEKFQKAQAILDDPVGETIDKIPGVQEGRAAADAGRRVGSVFGFKLYLMLTMGRDIAEYAAKR